MLRRPLTVIRLTTEDVLDYDDRKAKENEQQKETGAAQSTNGARVPGGLASKKTKEQRIGLSQ